MTEFKDGKHFAKIASHYDQLRTTDMAPIFDIGRILSQSSTPEPVVIDVGCGSGRYSFKLLEEMPSIKLIGLDPSEYMMSEFLAKKTMLKEDMARRVCWEMGVAEDMHQFYPGTIDVVTSFNAIHWFDVGAFVMACKHMLKPGGKLIVYTRTQEQNAQTIWGMYFPDFAEKETRLFKRGQFEKTLQPGMKLIQTKEYEYKRSSILSHLVSLALHKHYSTFELYGEEDFIDAVARFVYDVAHDFEVFDITWTDRNVLYVVEKL